MHRTSLPSLVAVLLASACSHGSSGSASSGGTGTSATNLGVSTLELVGGGNLFVANVSELAQGGLDLNGDGDALDLVVHVLDLSAGRLTNTGLAARAAGPAPDDAGDQVPPPQAQVNGRLAVFVVHEASQGSTDLNGDGDVLDGVLHVYDPETSTARNLGYAVNAFGITGLGVTEEKIAFVVTEFGQGEEDINGDGDAFDTILHVLDVSSSIVEGIITALGSPELDIEGQFIAYFVAESALVGDLNGDGDQDDVAVMHVYDTRSGTVTNTRIATLGSPGLFAGGAWTFLVRESDQGDMDGNGDGDADDWVVHTFDPAAGVARRMEIASTSPFEARATGDRVAVLVTETGMRADLNGDGDQRDLVPFLIDPATGTVRPTELAAAFTGALSFLEDWLAVGVWESSQGDQDLNGDGDSVDVIVHAVDLATGVAVNLGIEGLFFLTSERFLLTQRFERDGNQDWNGDGDLDDAVAFSWDARTGVVASTDTSNVGLMDLLGNTALIIVAEATEGVDLNGDGDLDDTEAVAFDLASGRRVDTGLSPDQARLVAEDVALMSISERRTGEDLNGDGDTEDSVLFRVDLFR